MQTDDIVKECVARGKAAPAKTAKQIVNEVMDEINGYKRALADRAEFQTADVAAVIEEEEKP